MTFTYQTQGTCARSIEVEIERQVIKTVRFTGGCRGNLEAISRLLENRSVREVVDLLRGVQCRNGTSCSDQLARALEEQSLRAAV